MLKNMWKSLIYMGIILIVIGILGYFFEKFNFKLPGDILIKKENFTFYFPIVTWIILSIILTLILNIFKK
jgi:uncharacterized membrane protein HdeD (DUF308 family)